MSKMYMLMLNEEQLRGLGLKPIYAADAIVSINSATKRLTIEKNRYGNRCESHCVSINGIDIVSQEPMEGQL